MFLFKAFMSQIPPKFSVPADKPLAQHSIQQPGSWFYALWKFSRPHTVIGTSLSVLGLFLIALANRETSAAIFSPWMPPLISLLAALVACLCGNVYIVGLNQLEDIAIDQINKPHLPLASGEFSRFQARVIVAIAGICSLIIAAFQGKFLLATVGTSLIIGTAYSLPPIRLKRFPLWASLCIFTVRGAIVNLGLFLHFNQGLPIPLSVWALTLFILVFTFAIAIFKDIPDLEGDRQYNITTFTVKLGQAAVFKLARWVLTLGYLGMALASFFLTPMVNLPFLLISHLGLLVWFWLNSLQVDLSEKAMTSPMQNQSYARFYQFIWKLFFLEYGIFPVACLLARVNFGG